MRNKIFGGIGMLWGGGMLVSFFVRGGGIGSGAFGTGQLGGLLFGVVLFAAGAYAFFKKGKTE